MFGISRLFARHVKIVLFFNHLFFKERVFFLLSRPDEFTAVAAAIAHATTALKRFSVDWPRLVLNFESVMEKAELALASSLLLNKGITDLKVCFSMGWGFRYDFAKKDSLVERDFSCHH